MRKRNLKLAATLAGAVLALCAAAASVAAKAAAGAVTIAGGTTVAGVTVAGATTLVAPSSDPFYAAPSDLASYPPGAVLHIRQVTLSGAMQSELKTAYQLLYRTTNPAGQAVTTVATVMIPSSPAPGARKLVSYQTAEDSLTLGCAPSYTMRGGNLGGSTQNLESEFIGQELGQGWDVVVPDYEGPQSEWAVGPMAAQATLDGIRAAENFAPDGLEGASTPVGINGYSGGAIASTWAEALAPDYARELNIVAVAAGGIFPNIDYTMSTLDGSLWYGVQIGVLVALDRAYPALNLPTLLNANGQALAARDAQDASGCAGAATNAPLGSAAQYSNYPSSQALAAVPQVASVLNHLNLDQAPAPTAPSFFYNAIGDELAHIRPVDQLVDRYCAAGATIDYQRDALANEHLVGLAVYWLLALPYLQNRFAGRPTPNTCPPGAKHPSPPSAYPPGCQAPSGTLSGERLGLVRLGMNRAMVRRAFKHSSDRRKRHQDFFCVSPTGIQVGYPSPKLLKTLRLRERKRFAGRAVWAATSNPYYAIDGIRPGASFAAASAQLKPSRPFQVGGNLWYFMPNGPSTTVVKVRNGVVVEIGIAVERLTEGRTSQHRLLASLG